MYRTVFHLHLHRRRKVHGGLVLGDEYPGEERQREGEDDEVDEVLEAEEAHHEEDEVVHRPRDNGPSHLDDDSSLLLIGVVVALI